MTLVGLLAVDLLSMLLLGLLVVPISILTLAVDEAGDGTHAPHWHGYYSGQRDMSGDEEETIMSHSVSSYPGDVAEKVDSTTPG